MWRFAGDRLSRGSLKENWDLMAFVLNEYDWC